MSFSFKITSKGFTPSGTNEASDRTSNATLVGSTVIEQVPKNPSRYSEDDTVQIKGISLNTKNPNDVKKIEVLSAQTKIDSLGLGVESSDYDVNCNFLTSIGIVATSKNREYSLINDQTTQPEIQNPNILIPDEYRKKRVAKKTTDKFKSSNDPFYDNLKVREPIKKQKDINLLYETRNEKALDITSYLAKYNLNPSNKKKLKALTKPSIYRISGGLKKKS
jgi:hypothetical protein